MSFHFFLSATNSLHLLTPTTWRSLSTSSFHPFLGLPLLLVPSSSWVKIFLGILSSSILSRWPNKLILCPFIHFTIFSPFQAPHCLPLIYHRCVWVRTGFSPVTGRQLAKRLWKLRNEDLHMLQAVRTARHAARCRRFVPHDTLHAAYAAGGSYRTARHDTTRCTHPPSPHYLPLCR